MTRLPARLAAAVLLAALLPPTLLVWISSRLERRALRDDLDGRAASTAAVTAALLSHAESFLATVGRRWSGGCGPDVAAALAAAVELGIATRDVSLHDGSSGVACRVGADPAPLPEAVRTALARDGRALWSGPEGRDGLHFAVRLPRGAAVMGLDGGRLAAALSAAGAGERFGAELVGATGTLLAAPPPVRAEKGPGLLLRLLGRAFHVRAEVAEAVGPTGAFRVRVRVGEMAQLAAWGETLPLLFAVGLGFGAGAAALVLLGGSPGSALTRQLRGALRRGELEVRYLPVVDVRSGRCVGAEALLRWRHAREGLLSPDLFIALAEETGLVVPITDWLMRQVARDLPDGLPEPETFHVSLNLAGAHLRDPGTVASVLRAFEGSRLRPSSLVFEVTEREFIEDDGGTARGVLEGLQAWGAKIALDDFGTGYSNIATLRRFRIDHLKIDRSFVEGIGTGSVAETVIDAVVDLGQRLEMTVVAEGIERAEQVEYLLARGVHLFQGFHFSLPLTLKGLVRFVEDRAATADGAGGRADEAGPERGDGAPRDERAASAAVS